MPAPLPPRADGRPARSVTTVAFAGAALFLYLRNFLLAGVPFVAVGDQSQFFERALRILRGQAPYRDFFAFVTPGTEYLYAAGFRILGVHAWVVAGWSIVVGLAFCWLLTHIASHLVRRPMVLLPALLFLVFGSSGSPDLTHHWFSTFAALAAAAVMMPGLTLPRVGAGGALCAIATLFTQTAGFAAFAAMLTYLVWHAYWGPRNVGGELGHGKRAAVFVLTFAAVLAPALGWFVHVAGWRPIYFDLVVFAPRYLSSGSAHYFRQFPPVHRASDLLHAVPVLFIYAVVPYIYIVGLFRIVRLRAAMSPALRSNVVLLSLLGVALFLSVVHSPSLFRLTSISAPAILICIWVVSGTTRWPTATRNALAAVAAGFAVIMPVHRQMERHAVLDLPIGRTAFTDLLFAREYRLLAANSHPGDSFFNDSGPALYLSLHNPTAIEVINERDFTRPEWIAPMLAALHCDPPRLIVFQPIDPALPRSGDHTAPLREFVRQNYTLVAVLQLNQSAPYDEEIWERK